MAAAVNKAQHTFKKIAGVGWDIHGYSIPHKELSSQVAKLRRADKAHDAKLEATIGKAPKWKEKRTGLLSFIGIGKKTIEPWEKHSKRPEVAAHQAKRKAYYKANPPPKDDYEYIKSKKIKTVFDKDTNYKLNSNININTNANLDRFTTDFAYGDTPVDKPLSKETLRKILKVYKSKGKEYQRMVPNDPFVAPGIKAFVGKGEALLKNPKTKFIRLEYE